MWWVWVGCGVVCVVVWVWGDVWFGWFVWWWLLVWLGGWGVGVWVGVVVGVVVGWFVLLGGLLCCGGCGWCWVVGGFWVCWVLCGVLWVLLFVWWGGGGFGGGGLFVFGCFVVCLGVGWVVGFVDFLWVGWVCCWSWVSVVELCGLVVLWVWGLGWVGGWGGFVVLWGCCGFGVGGG